MNAKSHTKITWWLLGWTAGLFTATAIAIAVAPASAATRTVERPPECHTVTIVENSGAGPSITARWCGTGSGGESPMEYGVRRLVVDGGRLVSGAVVLWPGSPPS